MDHHVGSDVSLELSSLCTGVFAGANHRIYPNLVAQKTPGNGDAYRERQRSKVGRKAHLRGDVMPVNALIPDRAAGFLILGHRIARCPSGT